MRLLILFIGLLPCWLLADYDEQLERNIARCAAIDPDDYHSGLWLNPSGYQTYFIRSQCFDQVAQTYRELSACSEVEERWALLSSGHGYTEERCRERVEVLLESDRKALARIRDDYAANPVRLTDFKVLLNGNGRDYDFRPVFSASGYPARYRLGFYLLLAGREYLLSENGYWLGGGENILQFEYMKDLRAAAPMLTAGESFEIEARLALVVPAGPTGAFWRPDMIEEILPEARRIQRVRRQISF